MKSFLNERSVVFQQLHDEIFAIYPKQAIVQTAHRLLADVPKKDASLEEIEEALDGVLHKTETFNILLTLLELDKRLPNDSVLLANMKDPSYNQHRTIAINICDMYGSGAACFFGYLDCSFKQYFPHYTSKSFLAKGICALAAAAAEVVLTGSVTKDYAEENLQLLESRGVKLEHLTNMVHDLQVPYNPTLTVEECEKNVLGVLRKQQTYHTISLCIDIDTGVEAGEFGEQFQAIVGNDEGLYGIDESVNTSVSKLYGMIAITNFGFLDKAKPGIIGELDSDHEGNHCNTFIDDTVCAIVSAACARLAHNHANTNSKPKK